MDAAKPPITPITPTTPITPVEPDAADAELASLIARAARAGVPGPLFSGILARSPVHARALLRAMLISHTEGSVDHRLKEMVRIRLARIAGDSYFAALRSSVALGQGLDEATIAAALGDFENDPRFTPAQRVALRYADRMYRSPSEVDDALYAELKKHYSEAQIMELGAFMALHYGMQAFMRTMSQ
jgi:alkylhydroperoxidase family enzyme